MARSNLRVFPLETEIRIVSCGQDILKHQERLHIIKKDARDDLRGCKTLSKEKPMYLEVKFKEEKFD